MPRVVEGEQRRSGPGRIAGLAEDARERSRTSVRTRARRVGRALPAVAQTGLAVGVAWVLADGLLAHPGAFMAPVAAILVLGITHGERLRRSVEVVVGVSVGVLVADLIVRVIGDGAPQLALMAGLAILVVVALGGSQLAVNQAAVSAVIVATFATPDSAAYLRFLDALIGGSVALVVAVLLPVDPARLVRREAGPLLERLAGVHADIARALERRSPRAAADALDAARRLDDAARGLVEAATTGEELSRFSVLYRRRRGQMARYAQTAAQVDLAVRNARVLARGAVQAVETGANVPAEAVSGLRSLADATRAVAPSLTDPARAQRGREHALRAAAQAQVALERTGNLSANVIVGQVRASAVDLLRGLGLEGDDAREQVRRAAAEARSEA